MGPEGSLSFQAKEAARRKAIRYSHSKCIGRRRRRTLQYTRRRDNPALLIAKVTDCAHCLSDIFAKTMNTAIGCCCKNCETRIKLRHPVEGQNPAGCNARGNCTSNIACTKKERRNGYDPRRALYDPEIMAADGLEWGPTTL